MRKKQKDDIDNRRVVIYARKSVITHKGASVTNQENYCKDFAIDKLKLPSDYDFELYEDEGKSGFYSDRPDFQRMIKDVEKGKIKVIVCYKLDRMSRRVSDLSTLMNFLDKKNVTLLVASTNNNSFDPNSKMMLQLLSVIAEFERDIIAERIQDNLMELAKDGRWMGGTTPTGFTTERIKTGTGKKRNAQTYLVPIPEEQKLVKEIFSAFLKTRSLNATAALLNEKGLKTKNGAKFTILAIRDIISNPVYCTADKVAYEYFIDIGANVFGDEEDFDGTHGISTYNRTEQYKEEGDNSTLLNPEFSQVIEKKDVEDWIVAIGRHCGTISSSDWIDAQRLKDEIADKYNRPHRATNALLSGIVYCPMCNRPLNVIPESNRFTNGKPRFKYACPNAIRKGPCKFVALRGVEFDELILEKLSSLTDEEEEYYISKLQTEIENLIKNDVHEKEISDLKKEIEKLESEIKSQTKNLRDAGDIAKKYILEDIETISSSISEKSKLLDKLQFESTDDRETIEEFRKVKDIILSFDKFVEQCDYEEIVTMVKSVVERIYVRQQGEDSELHLFIKGCTQEDYDDFFVCSDTQLTNSSMCDLDEYRELHSYICRNTAT